MGRWLSWAHSAYEGFARPVGPDVREGPFKTYVVKEIKNLKCPLRKVHLLQDSGVTKIKLGAKFTKVPLLRVTNIIKVTCVQIIREYQIKLIKG